MAGKRVWLAAAALSAMALAAGGWHLSRATPAQIERLRMAGEDSAPRLRWHAWSGDAQAQRALAQVLWRKQREDALYWAQRAAAQGDVEAAWMLGRTHFDGSARADHRADYAKARAWLTQAAQGGHAGAMHLLALMDKNGYGGAVNLPRSAQWLAQAVKLGHADAMFLLGNAYHDGQGVARDEQQALRLYQAAAEKEQAQAAQMLAQAHAEGRLGLRQDAREAALMMREVEHILSHHGP
ncbi:tetratricopeptide repeat protein [Massilia sp. W12]|uniref:tetratricopeptide repeat protein n=1 Tax=Massilia sp. W12 TaxID=3126507 RepID=UPI0030CBA967